MNRNPVFIGISMANPIFDEMAKYIENSYPNACILYIDEVVNAKLSHQYETRKSDLMTQRGAEKIKEMRLFHGTKAGVIDTIAENGFHKKYNKVSAYGKGTYFSTTATYSKNYSDRDNQEISYMFVCDVIVGNCVVVSGPREIDTKSYDNSVNNLINPIIYVSPYDDGCLPRFLIAFYKNT